MSPAFVKENDDMLSEDDSPSHSAWVAFLTWENYGIQVYEKPGGRIRKITRVLRVMSNGLSHIRDKQVK